MLTIGKLNLKHLLFSNIWIVQLMNFQPFWRHLSFLLSTLLFCSMLSSCSQPSSEQASSAQTSEGEQLANIHCGRCHVVPDPSQLDRATWDEPVLTQMGHFMGLYAYQGNREEIMEGGPARPYLEDALVYPKEPLISQEDWSKIRTYYLENAPAALEVPPPKPIKKGLTHFRVKAPSFMLSPPSTTLAQFNPDNTLYIGDAHTKALYHFGENLEVLNIAKVSEGAVSLRNNPAELLLTVMGSFSPSDNPTGFMLALPKNAEQQPIKVLDSLARPVHTTYADLNQDGHIDIVTCEFGKYLGGLAWWENDGNKGFTKHWLRKTAGATKAYCYDFDRNGLQDVIALFGQGDEGIYLFYNQGNGKFRSEPVKRFHPSMGSSFFELVDFNEDGHPDILFTAGDNADYMPILKPYHGIYGFLNVGDNQFSELFFYPLNGAYGAKATDFDLDGDLDIAAISFFPDFVNRPKEGFVYLENQGDYAFEASTFEDTNLGRWIVMDMGDYGQDGDADLLLGSLAFEAPFKPELVKQWVKNGIPFILLENTSADNKAM